MRRAAMRPTFWPGGAERRTVEAWPMCWWLPPPWGCSTGFMATPRTWAEEEGGTKTGSGQCVRDRRIACGGSTAQEVPSVCTSCANRRQFAGGASPGLAAYYRRPTELVPLLSRSTSWHRSSPHERPAQAQATHLRPAVALGLVLEVAAARLQHGLLRAAAAGHLAHRGAALARHHLQHAHSETHSMR